MLREFRPVRNLELCAWSAAQLNSMLCRLLVLTEHRVYKTLSTSLTLFPARFSPRGRQMPWKERSAMDEKTSFILGVGGRREHGQCAVRVIRDLTDAGVPRHRPLPGLRGGGAARAVTGSAAGVEPYSGGHGKSNRRVAPQQAPPRCAETAQLLRALRQRPVPGFSTIELILKRNGLVKKRRRVRRIRETHPIFQADGPNEIWSVDFKGEFRMGNLRYCYPLTVMDSYSRYVLAVVGMHQPTYEGARAVFQALFERTDCRSRSTATTGSRSPAR